MSRPLGGYGACDCHSHVFGPFRTFPLATSRTFEPPEAPIEALEDTWTALGIDRAVLIQGSAHGKEHRAMLAAIARSPATRRGVALLSSDVSDAEITALHAGGVRAVRFNWITHLLAADSQTIDQRLSDAATLLKRVSVFGWHAEVHIDISDLALLNRLDSPSGMRIVIDHMARIDLTNPRASEHVSSLLRLLENERFWAKLSGADRLTLNSDSLHLAVPLMRAIVSTAPDRCVWGLDWPHVNLARTRSDMALYQLLQSVAGNDETMARILRSNPEALYGFVKQPLE